MKWCVGLVIFSTLILIGTNAQSDIRLEDYEGCDYDAIDGECQLTCIFITNSTEFEVIWTLNGSSFEGQASNDQIYQTSTVTIDNGKHGNYTCTGRDSKGNKTAVHTFPISGEQINPKILHANYEILGTENCNVTFTCEIQANPPPSLVWVKKDVDGNLQPISEGNFPEATGNDTYEFSFTIPNYGQNDTGQYGCVVYNDIGASISKLMLPHVIPGPPVVSEQSVTFKPQDVIHINCTSNGGFPAPRIQWTMHGGERAKWNQTIVEVDNGLTVAYLDIVTSWSTDMAVFTCIVEDNITHKKYGSNAVHFYITNTPYMVNVNNCSADDFDNFGKCSLRCEAYSPSYVKMQWIYKFDKFADSYPLTNITYPSRTFYNGPYNVSLELTEYRPGLYECQFLSFAGNVSNEFKITGAQNYGDMLGAECHSHDAHNCGTLYANCNTNTNYVCTCPSEYSIPSDTTYPMFSSACLQKAAPETLCLNSKQCNAMVENYSCYRYSGQQYGICECQRPYYRTFIHETNTWECVQKASYNTPCKYDGECQLSDPFMECDDNYCDCVEDYAYTNSYCQYDTSSSYIGMSATAAIVISVSILIVIIFIVTLIFIRTNSRNSQRRRNRHLRTSNSETQLNSFPEDLSTDALPAYTISDFYPPPSYNSTQRCETPPPSFDSIADIKPDNDEAQRCDSPPPPFDSIGALKQDEPKDIQDVAGTSSTPQQESDNIFIIDRNFTGFINPAFDERF